MLSLLERLPLDILLHNFLPLLYGNDLVSFLSVKKSFYQLGKDDAFWEGRLDREFGFVDTAGVIGGIVGRDKSWIGLKTLYLRMFKPNICVWRMKDTPSLTTIVHPEGVTASPLQVWPPELAAPSTRNVFEMSTVPWSFAAASGDGKFIFWDRASMLASFGTHSRRRPNPGPNHILAKHVCHLNAADKGQHPMILPGQDTRKWQLTSYGQPFVLRSPKVDTIDSDEIIQVDTNSAVSCALTSSGSVLVWNSECENPRDSGFVEEGDPPPEALPWMKTGVMHLTLPRLPNLPNLKGVAVSSPPRLVQIAQGSGFILGVTDGGHVVKFSMAPGVETPTREDVAESIRNNIWKYLPEYSDRRRIQQLAASLGRSLPRNHTITHIAASGSNFVAYSTGLDAALLIGRASDPTLYPYLVGELQSYSLACVVLGDYNIAALTQDGRLFQWVRTPLLREPWGFISQYNTTTEPQKFVVLAIASCARHLAALVVNLQYGPPQIPTIIPPNAHPHLRVGWRRYIPYVMLSFSITLSSIFLWSILRR